MSNLQEYNGWPNFATWKVHLELFDGIDPNELFPDDLEIGELSDALRYYAREHVEETSSGLACDWALAFLSDVNFYSIARHMRDAYPIEDAAE